MPDETEERNRFVGPGDNVNDKARHRGGRGRPLTGRHRRETVVGVVELTGVFEVNPGLIRTSRVAPELP